MNNNLIIKNNIGDDLFDFMTKESNNIGVFILANKDSFKVKDKTTKKDKEEDNILDIYIKLEIDLEESFEKFQDYNFESSDSEYYNGEVLAIQAIKEHFSKNKLNHNGISIKIIPELEDTNEKTMDLDYFIDSQKKLRTEHIKKKMFNSESKNMFNSEDIRIKFGELGEAQRYLPEMQMLKCQKLMGGGVLSHLIEHIGDLTHRMSEKTFISCSDLSATIEYVEPKVEKGLRALKSGYGFEKEFLENMDNNYEYACLNTKDFNKSFEEWNKEIKDSLIKYSNEHSKLKVYNKAQYAAREAAVSLGLLDFNSSIKHLEYLNDIIKDESYIKIASEYDKDGYKPKLKRQNSKRRTNN